jgi:hypothetical protein
MLHIDQLRFQVVYAPLDGAHPSASPTGFAKLPTLDVKKLEIRFLSVAAR